MKENKNYKTLVINLFAGPGAGKSVMAAEVFSKLKRLGYETENVTEYAKDKVWEGSQNILDNQIYVFSKQHHKFYRLSSKVQFIVTDSPFFFSLIYDNTNNIHFRNLILSKFEDFNNINFFIERKNANYSENGRNQNLDEAIIIDDKIKSLLNEFNVPYISVYDDEKESDRIVHFVECALEDMKLL